MPAQTVPNRQSVGALLAQGYLAENTADIQRLSVAAYRLLAGGAPVSATALAGALAMNEARVTKLLDALPQSVLDRDARGRITGFIGLGLAPSAHRFIVGGQSLHTWCVLDALFLPEILNERATVTTICPASGKTITLALAPGRIIAASPKGVVMSVIAPDIQSCRENLRGAFCSHVNFFADAGIFADWAKSNPGAACVSLAEAFVLARERNRERYPDIDLTAALNKPLNL
ncbi:MAG: organomercurial lyase [Alphaproteobacteria bacterium]